MIDIYTNTDRHGMWDFEGKNCVSYDEMMKHPAREDINGYIQAKCLQCNSGEYISFSPRVRRFFELRRDKHILTQVTITTLLKAYEPLLNTREHLPILLRETFEFILTLKPEQKELT